MRGLSTGVRIVSLTGLLLIPGTAVVSAQVVEGIGFYQDVQDRFEKGKRFIFPGKDIPNDSPIALGQLPKLDERPTVYVAITLTAPTVRQKFKILFQRKVASDDSRCAQEKDQIVNLPQLKNLKEPTGERRVAGFVELIRRNIVDIIGGDAAYGSVKISDVVASPGERTFYDWRHVHCPGQLRVWVTDSNYTVLEDTRQNSGITLNISD